MKKFVKIYDSVVNADDITDVQFRDVEKLRLWVHVRTINNSYRTYEIEGIEAIDLLMIVKPSALEGKRLRWAKHAWAIHNLIGHPLMQLLAFFKQYDLAIKVHELTVPRPKGIHT